MKKDTGLVFLDYNQCSEAGDQCISKIVGAVNVCIRDRALRECSETAYSETVYQAGYRGFMVEVL